MACRRSRNGTSMHQTAYSRKPRAAVLPLRKTAPILKAQISRMAPREALVAMLA